MAFDDLKGPIDPVLVEEGRKLHRDACASCHAQPASAFVAYPVARMLAPATGVLDAGRADAWLLYFHVFACFVGLASLPFTRFFHALAAPISLLVNGAAPGRELPVRNFSNPTSSSSARASRRALAIDACVRCGICDVRCSVEPLARYLGNPGLLPSHKLLATGKTDLLENFVSNKTRRKFKAFLVKQGDGKVGFEFAPRIAKATAKTKAATKKTPARARKTARS